VAVLGRRAAEPFEELRRASDAALVRVGSRPPVFLALIGSPEDYRSRSAWVQSFFAAGGVQAIVPDAGFIRLEDLVAAFRASPAPVACLCSSDSGYAALPGAVAALREANAMFVYLAGSSSGLSSLAADDRRGLDRIIYEGCDAARLLGELHQILRVEDMGQMAFDEDDIVDEG
jgi:methylmalonyl-CoA mutase